MARFELKLPRMGESVAEATITNWLKAVGDNIEADEAVLEIATDKVDSEVPSEVQGILVEKIFENDDLVQVGQTIAIIETEAVAIEEATPNNGVGAIVEAIPNNGVSAIVEAIPNEEVVQEVEKTKTSEDFSDSVRFYSPLVKNIAEEEGITLKELEGINGSGKEGRITKNNILEYVATKGSVAPVPAVEEAVIPVAVPAPAVEVPVVEKVVIPVAVSAPVVEVPVVEKVVIPVAVPAPAVEVPVVEKVVSPVAVSTPAVEVPVVEKVISPVAVQEAPKTTDQKSIPIVNAKAIPVSINGADEIIEMDRMGKIIAHHMVQSVQTSVHVQSFIEVDVTNIWKWREKNKNAFEKREGEKLTFTPIFMEAIVKTIKDFPLINISVEGDYIIKKKNINLGMATALPSGNLIVPVIKNADQLNLVGMAKAVNDFAIRARNNQLKPDEVQGGTYTVTNIGSFGSVFGTPVINQPQVAIIAIGAIRKVPAVIEAPEGDFIGIRHKMFLSHTYDHRVVNGALGGEFLKRVGEYLERFDINRDF